MDKEHLRKKRRLAVSFKLDLEKGDRIVDLLSRESGLFIITQNSIFRTKSPDDLDPNLEHPDAPWEQSIYLPHGSSDPLVARTILQTKELGDIIFGRNSDRHRQLMDVAWEVLNSFVSLRMIKDRLQKRVSEITAVMEADIDAFTKG